MMSNEGLTDQYLWIALDKAGHAQDQHYIVVGIVEEWLVASTSNTRMMRRQ